MSFEIYGPDPTVLDRSGRKPHVLIVGAGLAGLTLANLLHKADVPFDVFEKMPESRAVGATLFLAPQVLPIFQQLGILDEYLAQSLPCSSINFFSQDRQPDFQLDFQLYSEITGSEGRTIPHSTLHTLLLSQLPPTRIHTSKRMLSFTQGENGVLIRFSDSKTFEGDVLVGADGPNSAVRQGLFEHLRRLKKLPSGDAKSSREMVEDVVGEGGGGVGGGGGGGGGSGKTVFLVGLTERLGRDEYFPPEDVKEGTSTSTSTPTPTPTGQEKQEEEEHCKFFNIRSTDQPFSWNTATCRDNRISWSVTQHPLPPSSQTSSSSSCSPSQPHIVDWSADGVVVESMCNHILHLAAPGLGPHNNLTIGDLIAKTPREGMGKVVVEERMFETWYGCRTVLIGDACHKLHPAGNQGAHLALLDALSLSFVLSSSQTLPTTQLKHLTRAFKRHKRTRLPPTRKAWLLSKALAKVYTHDTTTNSRAKGKGEGGGGGKKKTGQGANLLRKVVGKVPAWAWKKVFERLLVDDIKPIKGSDKAAILPGGVPTGTGGSSGVSNANARARGDVQDAEDEEEDEEVLSPEEQEAVEKAVTALVSGDGSVEGDEDEDDEDLLTSSTLSLSSLSLSTSSRNGAAVV